MKESLSNRGIKNSFFNTKNIAYLAVLTALILVLQLTGAAITITPVTKLSFVLLPIVLGAMILGPLAGALLGFVFGLIVLIQGIVGVDGFTFILFSDHPIITSLLCLVKGTAAGFGSGLIYKAFKQKEGKVKTVGAFIASGSAPIINTGLFILGALLMSDTLSSNFVGEGETVIYFLVIGCAGFNFIVEFAFNLIFAPAILRITNIIEKNFRR